MTSGKKSKTLRKEEEAELRADLEAQLQAAMDQQAEKLDQSKAHLVAQLRMAHEKYLTVNGYMQARSTYDQAAFGVEQPYDADKESRQIAAEMSMFAAELADAIEATDVLELDEEVLDGYLDKGFVKKDLPFNHTVTQLLIVNLLQNIGPSIDDIVSFREGSAAGIAKLEEELDALGKRAKLSVV